MALAAEGEASSLVVNGTRIDMIERGSGRPLLFLHAENGIEPATAAIAELAKHARVIAPTHPGYGRPSCRKGCAASTTCPISISICSINSTSAISPLSACRSAPGSPPKSR